MVLNAQVFDTDMLILSGANVVEVDQYNEPTGNATTTDAQGRFYLNVPSVNTQVRISFVGYYYDTFRAGDINGKFVELASETVNLDDVNVPGSTKAKSDNTIWIVLAAVAITAGVAKIVSNVQKNKPKSVKP